MKKILLIITMFFFCTQNIYADDNLVIENIKVNNGVISPKFNKYNNYYSATISDDTNKLDLDITYDDSVYDIEIINNNNLKQNMLVYVNIFNKETLERNSYILKIYIENKDYNVASINEDELSSLEINKPEEKKKEVAPFVGAGCFVLILLVYYIMFLR